MPYPPRVLSQGYITPFLFLDQVVMWDLALPTTLQHRARKDRYKQLVLRLHPTRDGVRSHQSDPLPYRCASAYQTKGRNTTIPVQLMTKRRRIPNNWIRTLRLTDRPVQGYFSHPAPPNKAGLKMSTRRSIPFLPP